MNPSDSMRDHTMSVVVCSSTMNPSDSMRSSYNVCSSTMNPSDSMRDHTMEDRENTTIDHDRRSSVDNVYVTPQIPRLCAPTAESP